MDKKIIIIAIIFSMVAAIGYAVSTMTVTGYAVYTDGRIFSGVVRATIKETGDAVANATYSGRFTLNLANINLTSGKIYTLIVLATDNVTSSSVERTFVAG